MEKNRIEVYSETMDYSRTMLPDLSEFQQKQEKDSLQAFEKFVQSAIDRATNKLGNENKRLRERLEQCQKEKMANEERMRLEIADKEAKIVDREARLLEQENRFYAMKAIKTAGLDSGDTLVLELIDFVMDKNRKAIDEKVNRFSSLVRQFVKSGKTGEWV